MILKCSECGGIVEKIVEPTSITYICTKCKKSIKKLDDTLNETIDMSGLEIIME